MARYFFNVGEDPDAGEEVIVLRQPTPQSGEGDDLTIGDTYQQLRAGEKIGDVTYEQLREAGGGILVVDDDGKARIEAAESD